MDFVFYSLSLILGYAVARFVTERTTFHLRMKGVWIHHWILSAMAMALLAVLGYDEPQVWGFLTGVALDGLSRKNWSIKDTSET